MQHLLLEWEFLLWSLRSLKQVTQPQALVPLKSGGEVSLSAQEWVPGGALWPSHPSQKVRKRAEEGVQGTRVGLQEPGTRDLEARWPLQPPPHASPTPLARAGLAWPWERVATMAPEPVLNPWGSSPIALLEQS